MARAVKNRAGGALAYSSNPVICSAALNAPPGHENYFEELADLASRSSPPDATAIGELRRRYDTDQLSALQRGK